MRSARIILGAGVLISAASQGLALAPAYASTVYTCPLSSSTVCSSPLSWSEQGDVSATSDGYAFDLDADGSPGYIKVSDSDQIDTSRFPITFSVEVKGVHVPSLKVGDYDVVRGTPSGNWKIEVVARNSRTQAKAACFFKGATGKANVVGGPDLTTLQGAWTTLTCTNTGSAVQLAVNGSVVNSKSVTTGQIPNPGPLLIGAKDTTGGDQYSGYARNVEIQVP